MTGLKLAFRGKVRDIYDLGDKLLIVATDRISAFDHILPTPIPNKGKILTQLSSFWFRQTAHIVPNHMISTRWEDIKSHLPPTLRIDPDPYAGRVMLVWKAKRLDVECVVRGYLAGSGWKEYCKTGMLCGQQLPKGLQEGKRLAKPLFTPATKAASGHDQNMDLSQLVRIVGPEMAAQLEKLSLEIYEYAADFAQKRGLILADTKFEFGLIRGKLILIDELLTPDSSRFWDSATYQPGGSPQNFDKQFVRDYLERTGWDKNPPAPSLPSEVVEATSSRYQEALQRLTS